MLPVRPSSWVAAAAVLVAVPTMVAAAKSSSAPVDAGVYTMASGASGKCLDVSGAATSNNAPLVQVACATVTHQQFRVAGQNGGHALANVNSGKCVDVPNATTASGTQLWQYTCGGSTNQTWTFTASTAAAGKYLVKSASSGLCLSDRDGSTAGNNPIVQEACSDTARMQWSFNLVGGTAAGPVLAFPGAVGFGSAATGGRGAAVYHVTNLNDSGAGSFRDAVSASNRIVVFDVGGYVNLSSAVSVKSNLTIAGQTAPGGGIGFMAREVSFANSSNVIVRNVRFRQGDLDPDTKKSGINFYNATNLIFDHVSIEFAQWNNIDSVGATNITVQYSIDADPIGQQFAAHTETGPYTWYNNLFANAHNRCPLAKANTVYINNVVYNYQAGYTAGNSSGHFLHDVVGNYFITGPRTTNSSNAYYQMGNQTVYNSGNILDSNKDGVLNGSSLAVGAGGTATGTPWSSQTSTIPTLSAAAAYANVIAKAGATPRDQVDTLVVADVTSLGRAGDLWAHQSSTGLGNSGYGTLAGGAHPADSDNDGMPDAWETKYGTNPGVADSTGDVDHTGYTNIEKYINGLLDGTYR